MKRMIGNFQIEINHFKIKSDVRLNLYKEYYALKKKLKSKKAGSPELQEIKNVLNKQIICVKMIHKNTGLNETMILYSKPTKDDYKKLQDQLILKIQEHRKKTNQKTQDTLDYYGLKILKQGNVFLEKDGIKNAALNNKKNNIKVNKIPYLKYNYIGVELEFNVKNDYSEDKVEISQALSAIGLTKYCNLTEDGSCGHELRVLLPEKNFVEPLSKIMDILHKLEYRTNDSCGMHVHFDMRNRDVARVYKNLFMCQDLLYKLVNSRRKENQYCRPNPYTTFDESQKVGQRYHGINTVSFKKHNTLEIRIHHGTLKSKVAVNWIKILLLIINYEKEITSKINHIRTFSEFFKLSLEQKKTMLIKRNNYRYKLSKLIYDESA